MTVEQLIAVLSRLPPQLRVIMPGENFEFEDVYAAFVDLVWFDGQAWRLTDERQADRTEVVRLFGPDAP